MTETNTLMNVYVLTNPSNDTTLTSAEQLKSDQFINLLTTCNILAKMNSNLPSDEVLAQYQLIFIDFANITNTIPDNILTLAAKYKVVLFNCRNEQLCEKQALLARIQGVFYSTDRADIILKGIENLFADERWFKRETMNTAIGELLSSPNSTQQDINFATNDKFVFPSLTKREKTIINLVSSGAKNKEIANQLHISPNTVKTHIYSIFRKTSSRNRIELLSWTKQFQQVS